MTLLVIGFILLIIVIVVVKAFDSEIRPYHWRKVVVNFTMITGLVFIIVGLVQLILL